MPSQPAPSTSSALRRSEQNSSSAVALFPLQSQLEEQALNGISSRPLFPADAHQLQMGFPSCWQPALLPEGQTRGSCRVNPPSDAFQSGGSQGCLAARNHLGWLITTHSHLQQFLHFRSSFTKKMQTGHGGRVGPLTGMYLHSCELILTKMNKS